MKELSIEEKAHRYDKAFRRAKKLYEQGTITESLNYVFPELKESDGERIRKMLINFFSHGVEYNSSTNGIYDKDIVAWLEKQGKNPTVKMKTPDTCSKDDEKILDEVILDLEVLKNKDSGEEGKAAYQKEIDWLKSLKSKNNWKPSDEQMAALSDIIVTGDISYAGQGQELINLYNDLKKLKLW